MRGKDSVDWGPGSLDFLHQAPVETSQETLNRTGKHQSDKTSSSPILRGRLGTPRPAIQAASFGQGSHVHARRLKLRAGKGLLFQRKSASWALYNPSCRRIGGS